MRKQLYFVRIMSDNNIIQLPNEALIAQAEEFLGEGLDVVLLANGRSMSPFIRHGKDLLVLRRCPVVNVEDVVLARTASGKYVVHRVIDITEDAVTLKGDGNLYAVECCTLKDVVGTLVEIRKPDGRIVSPDRGRKWHKMPLLIRRAVLAICKRLEK